MKEDMWRMIGEDTSTAVRGVGIVGGEVIILLLGKV